MSNPKEQSVEEKTAEVTDVEMQSQGSDTEKSEGEEIAGMREIVLALPAMQLRESFDDDEDKHDDMPGIVLSGTGAPAVAEVAEEKGKKGKEKVEKGSASASGAKKRVRKVTQEAAGASGSGGEAKPKKKAPELTDPPSGEPTCPHCNRKFASWKAAFGHLRAHKDREHKGFLPPPKFTPPSSPRRQPEAEAAAPAAAEGGAGASGSRGGLGIDLNAPPEEEATAIAGFDLNKTPPKEDSDEDQD